MRVRSTKRRRIEGDSEKMKLVAGRNDMASKFLRNLYLNETTADVYFVCGDEKKRIPAHKNILGNASSVFYKMFYGNSAEKCDDVVKLPKTSPGAFEDFLQLFYTDELDFHKANITEIINLAKKYGMPMSRILYELNFVPERDSTKHILNALNDDCIQVIFRKLSNVRNYLNVAKVCTRFRDNVISAYPPEFKKRIDIRNRELLPTEINEFDAISFMSIFGTLVESINVWDCQTDILNKIDVYCGKTLLELSSIRTNLDFNTRKPFEALRNLKVGEGSNITNFNLHSQLVKLTLMQGCNFDFMRNYPRLVDVCFDAMRMHANEFGEFLSLNPQLRLLGVRTNTPSILEHIGNYGQNILSLTFTSNGYRGSEELMHLGKLRYLRALKIRNCHIETSFTNRLFDLFAENSVPIEILDISSSVFGDKHFLEKLKSLKRLIVKNIPEKTLIKVVEHLPKLEEFRVHETQISINGIRKILEVGKCLTTFEQLNDEVGEIISLKDYQMILAQAKHRVKVIISYKSGKISKTILNANCKWLRMK